MAMAAWLGNGCTSVETHLARHEAELIDEYRVQASRMANLEERELDWSTALRIMLANNSALADARNGVARAKERQERVLLDLLPGVRLTAGLDQALTELGAVDTDDLSFSVYSFLGIPSAVSFRTRYYRAKLEYLRAQWAEALKRRELTVQLRELFLRSRNLAQQQRFLAREELWRRPETSAGESLRPNPEGLEREARLFQLRRQRMSLQQSIAQLLGLWTHRWVLDAETVPELDYGEVPIELEDIDEYGVLLRRLQACELEGGRLQKLGVKLQYWPDISVHLSVPALYSVRNNRERTARLEDVLFSVDASVSLDTRLAKAYQMRDVKRQVAQMHKRMKQEIAGQVQRLLLAQEELALAKKRLALVEFQFETMKASLSVLNARDLRRRHEELLSLMEQRASLELEIARLEGAFWLVDEKRWPESAHVPDPSAGENGVLAPDRAPQPGTALEQAP